MPPVRSPGMQLALTAVLKGASRKTAARLGGIHRGTTAFRHARRESLIKADLARQLEIIVRRFDESLNCGQ